MSPLNHSTRSTSNSSDPAFANATDEATVRRVHRRATKKQLRRARQKARQGVVLLLVVTLLVMFLLIGVTGVIVATAYHTGAKAASNQVLREVKSADFSDRVVMQLLRGADQRSALFGHDLLADLYGVDSYIGTVQAVALDPQTTVLPPTTVKPMSPILKLTVTITNRFDNQTLNTQRFFEPDFFAGRLFTFVATDGSLKVPTVRILRSDAVDLAQLHDTATYAANQVQYTIIIDNERNVHGTPDADNDGVPELTGYRFMIGGAPFNGTGAGYKVATGWTASSGPLGNGTNPADMPQSIYTMNQRVPFDIDQDGDAVTTPDLQIHTWLLPNYGAYAFSYNYPEPLKSQVVREQAPLHGGADEGWDAVDLQNMWLARVEQLTGVVTPSFYRCQQIRFFAAHVFTHATFDDPNIDADTGNPFLTTPIRNLSPQQKEAFRRVLRAAVLRPLPAQHPAFTGGNANFTFDLRDTSSETRTPGDILALMANEALVCDVDTDGDQVKDAVWVDPGLPVQSTRDGRRYKVLAAIKVEDLNARVNLNTAMNEAYAYQNFQPMQSPVPGRPFFAGNQTTSPLSGRGSGLGGSEISIPLPTSANYGNLQEFIGVPTSMAPTGGPSNRDGRYGRLNETPVGAVPGGSVAADILLAMRGGGIDWGLQRTLQFHSPEQVFGVRQIGLDHDGQPLFASAVNAAPPRPALISPYRFNPLWWSDPNDEPFRNTESESQLRTFDADTVLMDERIQTYLQKLGPSDLAWSKNITYLSTHIPVAGQQPQKEYRASVEGYTRNAATHLPDIAGFAGFISTAFDQLYLANQSTHKTAPGVDPSIYTPSPIEQKHLALVLVDQGSMAPGTPVQLALARARARADFKSMLPFELRHGHAMDVNRPFGNGWDDTTNWGGIGASPGAPWLRNPDGRIDNNILIQRTAGAAFYDAVAEDFNPQLPTPPNPGASRTNDPAGQFAYGSPATQTTMSAANPGYNANSHFLNDLPDLTLAANNIRTTGPVANSLSYSTDPRQYYARHLFVMAYLSLRTDSMGNKFMFGFDNMTFGLSAAEQSEMVMRRLAQWAVNVADYRDPDSVMTCFEYDSNLLNGWDVDGDPRTQEPEARVVWGCERPELLLSESLALHDRCVADSPTALPLRGTAMAADQELDQVKFPQASLFLELYCPRPRSLGNASVQAGDYPTDMYGAGPSLDLERMAPAAPDGTRSRPVWRIVISESVNVNGAVVAGKDPSKIVPEDYFLLANSDINHHRVTYQPEAMIGVPNGLNSPTSVEDENLVIDREIWFSRVDLDATSNPNALNDFGIADELSKRKIYYNRGTTPSAIQPGRYMVIGPRMTTQIGQGAAQQITFSSPVPPAPQVSVQVYTSDPTNHPYAWGGPNATFNTMPVQNNHPSNGKTPGYNGDNVAEQNVQPANVMICASLLPDDPAWTATAGFDLGVGGAKGVGINISMKNADIAEPYWAATHAPDQAGDTYTLPPDRPFDEDAASTLREDGIVADPTTPAKSTGTQLKYKVAFLQRLADPNLPYNPMPPPTGSTITEDPNHNHRPELPVNPYITVDSMSLDLTVFNGSEAPHEPIGAQEWDTGDVYQDQNMDGYDPNTPDDDNWRITTAPQIRFATREKGAIDPVGGQASFWTPATTDPTQTVDKTNPMMAEYGQEIDPNAHFDFNIKHSLGYLNESINGLSRQAARTGAEQIYNGSPVAPFPWLAWANGPFSSAYEVMMVPASGPNRLMHDMGDIVNVPLTARQDFYSQQATPEIVSDAAQFTYLLNFFRSESTASAGANAPDLSRMLELLTTPNQFVGSDRWYRPDNLPAPSAHVNNTAVTTLEATHDRRAPFNYVPQFREAGRINLNTTQQYVWEGAIAANFPEHLGRSAVIGPSMIGSFMNASPELFNNPLRPADTSELLPNFTTLGGANVAQPYTSAMAGLLRQQTGSMNSVFANAQNTPAVSADHPGFRYQGISRLANTTTNQANAFAVWITLGKFEVNYNPANPTVQDGYELENELGFEDGTQQRHRSFFIIDRTKPVAYETGKNHNAAECILLRRVLE